MSQRLRVTLVAALVFLGTQAVAAQRSIPMVLPQPIDIPQNVSPEQATKALLSSLAGRGWTPAQIQHGIVEGTLNVRQHMLKLRFTIGSDRRIYTQYLDSDVLGYEVDDGVPHIHPSVMKWTRNLENDLRSKLLQY